MSFHKAFSLVSQMNATHRDDPSDDLRAHLGVIWGALVPAVSIVRLLF